MMHIFGIFNRKKRNSGSSSRPNFKNSVHPAIIKRREVYTVKRAKVKEILGVKTPQECQEVDELLDRACWRGFLSDQDVESVGSGVTEEIELEFEGVCDHGTRLEANCPPYCDRIEPMAHDLAQHAHPSSCKFDTSHKRCDEHTAANSTPLDQPVKADIAQGCSKTHRKARPPRLASVSRNKGASTADKGLPLERLTGPHSSRIGSEKMGDCIESFPLPLPFEKHYLPTPRPHASEEASSVAHPLPQPPLTGAKSFDNKDQPSVVRAVSCEPSINPRLSAREYETIVRAMSCDPHKLKGRSVQGLQEFPQTTGSMAVQPRAYQTPQSTPPTTPNHQPSRSLYISPPASSPSSRAHGTPQNTPPRSPCLQSSHVPQGAPPIMSRVQCFQTPQNTPPSTPGRQLHSQLLTNKTEKLPLSSSPSRHSPRLKLHLQNQSPVLFTSEQSHYTHSPPSSPLAGSLCPRNWTKGRLLGRGTFGNVYEGHNREDGSFFAVKVSSKEAVSPEIQQELDVLSKLDHPNIVRYLGSSIAEKQLCIFLELVTIGSLDFVLKKYKRLEENTIRNYTKQILLGLEYLHRKGTIHRDIKCSNILVDVNGQVKLSDFGIAKQIGESLTSSVKGTPLYMAPEVLGSVTDCYSFPADIWSLGCTVLEMADGKPPWSDLKGFAFVFKVKKGELPPLPEHLSLGGRDFIQQCLQLAPKDRPTASELLQHPFVLNAVTPEPLLTRSSPPSPLVPLMWANEESCPISPNRVTRRHQRAQTQLHGR